MSQVDSHDIEGLFDLVYEGAGDESARTLQRIKGVFVADLSLSIPEVQRIIEHAPATISSAESSDELTEAYEKLAAAGARVLIIRRGGPDASPHGDTLIEQILAEASNATSDEELEETEQEEPAEEIQQDDEFSFEFEVNSGETKSHSKDAARTPKTYTLDLEADASVDDILSSFETPGDAESATSKASAPADATAEVPDAATPNNGGISLDLLSEEELAVFHLSRGGSLVEPKLTTHEEPESISPLVDPSVPLDIAPVDPNLLRPTSPGNHDRDLARAISLVLEGVAEPEEDLTTSVETPAGQPSKQQDRHSGTEKRPPSMFGAAGRSSTKAAEPQDSPEDALTFENAPTSSERTESPKDPPATLPPKSPSSMDLDLSLEPAVLEGNASPPPLPVKADESQTAPTNAHNGHQKAGASPKSTLESESVEIISDNHTEPQVSSPSSAQSEHASAAPSDEPRRSPVHIARKRSNPFSSLEMMIPIVLGSIVLGVGNWLYFSASPPPPSKKLLVTAQTEATEALAKPTRIPLKIWQPSLQEASRTVNARIERSGSITMLESLIIESPLQRERTNEEVARGIPLPPWTKRIEAGPMEFKSSTPEETGDLSASGNAIAYIVYAGTPARVPLKIQVSLAAPTAQSGFILKFEGENGKIPEGLDRSLLSMRNEDGSFSIATSGTLSFGEIVSSGHPPEGSPESTTVSSAVSVEPKPAI